jgi:ribosomal protein L7/L12
MDVQLLLAGGALLLVGFVLGRLTSPRERSTVVYQPPAGTARGAARDLVPGAPPIDGEVEAHLRAGRKIDAIRRYRELHGVGLKEAKDAVEALDARLAR